jgi:hypothetical protein
MRARLLLGFAVVAALGCGRQFVPVSGKVTMDGEPLAGVLVSFQPVAKEGTVEAGPGSQATTDAKGEFTLTASTGEKGAVVGKHRVIISRLHPEIGGRDERAPRGGWPLGDEVPSQYSSESTLTFDVPPGGTTKADFPLTTAPPP